MIGVRLPAGIDVFAVRHRVGTVTGPHLLFYPAGYLLVSEMGELGADLTPLTAAELDCMCGSLHPLHHTCF